MCTQHESSPDCPARQSVSASTPPIIARHVWLAHVLSEERALRSDAVVSSKCRNGSISSSCGKHAHVRRNQETRKNSFTELTMQSHHALVFAANLCASALTCARHLKHQCLDRGDPAPLPPYSANSRSSVVRFEVAEV